MTALDVGRVRALLAEARAATERRTELMQTAVAIADGHWPAALTLVGLTLRSDFAALYADCNRLAEAELAKLERGRAA